MSAARTKGRRPRGATRSHQNGLGEVRVSETESTWTVFDAARVGHRMTVGDVFDPRVHSSMGFIMKNVLSTSSGWVTNRDVPGPALVVSPKLWEKKYNGSEFEIVTLMPDGRLHYLHVFSYLPR